MPDKKLPDNNPVKSQDDGWIDADKKTPKCNKKFGESEYVLGYEDLCSMPVVVWYSKKSKEWRVAHYKADSLSVSITHWQPLPEPPKT